jgi:hypothetical protein
VTAAHVFTSGQRSTPASADVSKLSALFPALDDQSDVKLGELAFVSKELDVAVVRLLGSPPKGAVPIDQIGSPRNKLEGVAVLHWTALDGFAIGFGHGISPPQGDQSSVRRENTDTQVTAALEPGQLYYTHVTGRGASGAPVFDANTGDLVCLHQAGMPTDRRPWAYCRSITALVDAIRRGQ